MQKEIQKLADYIRAFPLLNECNQTRVPYLTIYRFTTDLIKLPDIETPYLYIIVDGSMRLHTPSGIMDYMVGQYSVSAIDTPVSGQILTFSEKKDFIALSIEFTIDDVISVVLDLEGDFVERIMDSKLQNQRCSAVCC